MNMLSTQPTQSLISFKSGLNKNVVNLQRSFECKLAEQYFAKQHINTDFINNKSMALSTNIAAFILNTLHSRFNFFSFWTPSVNVYNKENLLLDTNLYHFCIPECKKVLMHKPIYERASIFYSNVSSLEELDAQAEQAYKYGIKPSKHFLTDIIHEMMHAVLLKRIYDKHESNSLNILQNLQYKKFNEDENKIIADILGSEATCSLNQYHEVFANTFTKIICDSLTKDSFVPSKNPMELLKCYPKEFIEIIKKIFKTIY